MLVSVLTTVITPEEPMWTDVVSAISSGFASVVALGVAFYSIRAGLQERQEQRKAGAELRESQKRSQAEMVACWMEADPSKYPSNWIVVHNASPQPIWSVRVTHPNLYESPIYIPVLSANSEHRLDVNPNGKVLDREAVEVQFRDNRGLTWRRPTEFPGALAEVEAEFGNPTVTQAPPDSEPA
ncbi:hypothetical protein QF015_002172 [Paenarthrobacter sp. TE4293]|uniref:hypothetical protein n=1 Tax=Paenarthrobacter sp. TE4293 TaxID=3381695 RepID=UPI003D208213